MSAAVKPVEPETPYYAKRDRAGFYTWEGVQYPSVTTILSEAPGQHLMLWASKMAAMRAASLLVAAGIKPPEHLAQDDALADFCEGKDETLTKAEALEKLFSWQHVMRESERYRDFKARIGSVTHHALYENALGVRVPAKDLEDYLRFVAISLGPGIWKDDDLTFKPSEEQVCELARLAAPYVLSAFEWVELDKPEWEAIGQEAVVISLNHGYAGTKDGRALLRSVNGVALPEPKVYDLDFKTSNSLAKSVRFQVEAYRHADFIGLMATGQTFPIDSSCGVAALHIGPHADHAQVSDEFGTLASKAKIMGAKLWTADGNEEVFNGFLGLLAYYRATNNMPAWDQSRSKKPAEPKPSKFEARKCAW